MRRRRGKHGLRNVARENVWKMFGTNWPDTTPLQSPRYEGRQGQAKTSKGKLEPGLHWHLPRAHDTISDNKAQVMEPDPRTEARPQHLVACRKTTCVFTASQNASGPYQVHLESSRPTSVQGPKKPKTATGIFTEPKTATCVFTETQNAFGHTQCATTADIHSSPKAPRAPRAPNGHLLFHSLPKRI